MKKDTNSVSFTYERTLRVRRPEFKFAEHVQFLDPKRLSKGSHSIEIGRLEGGGCDITVSAKIKDGMVTGFEHPRCEDARPIPPNLDDKLVAAFQTLTKKEQRERNDFPVEDLVEDAAVGRRTGGGEWDDCFWVCWDEGIGEQCVMCCFEPTRHWCVGPSEPTLIG